MNTETLKNMTEAVMTYQDYIKIFREECGEHLPWEEAKDLEALFVKGDGVAVFMELEKLRRAARIPSPRFEKALADFYWQFTT